MNRFSAWRVVLAGAVLAGSASGSAQDQLNTGVQKAPPRAGPPDFHDLPPAQQRELILIDQARRNADRPGTNMDCGEEQGSKPMTDLERANWRLKCGK